jgi:adenine-specific DNA-methyltransferase
MNLQIFNQIAFLPAIKALFNWLKVPINFVTDEPTSAKEILKDTFKENETFNLINDVYFVGMVDDAAFNGNSSLAVSTIKSDYDGVLIFGVTLKDRPNSLLPTRAQLDKYQELLTVSFIIRQ